MSVHSSINSQNQSSIEMPQKSHYYRPDSSKDSLDIHIEDKRPLPLKQAHLNAYFMDVKTKSKSVATSPTLAPKKQKLCISPYEAKRQL